VLVAQGDDEHMNAVALTSDLELREDRRHPPVARGVADVLLAGLVIRRIDHKLVVLAVVGRGRPEVLDIRSVAGLGDREAAGQLQGGDRPEVAFAPGSPSPPNSFGKPGPVSLSAASALAHSSTRRRYSSVGSAIGGANSGRARTFRICSRPSA
jgi:hypothetical protein